MGRGSCQRSTAPPPKESASGSAASGDASSEPEESETNRKPSSLEIVAVAVYDALFSPMPKLHYLVGMRWEGDRVLNAVAAKLLDENDNPQHNYSREQVVALPDRHITERART